MCGIVGVISKRPYDLKENVEKMIHSLSHRGPDGSGMITLQNCVLGHRRLSIIDLETGNQPMANDSGRYNIIFNGEIYNYRELRKDLETLGAKFQTNSDTEVILQAYLFHGKDMPRYLNGQFAFFIWDNVEQEGFAARDRLGEKPFYWAESKNGDWLFASEIKAILRSDLIRPVIDLQALDMYLALLYTPPDRTIYKNIHTLQAGHALIWKLGDIKQWQYWQPVFSTKNNMEEDEAIKEVERLVTQAVHRQMVSDVPIGAFLSGGLDSSTVVALMSKFSSQPVKTFAVGFGDLINELPYARVVAEKYKTDHHEIQMDIPVSQLLEQMAGIYDEPFADSSNIPTFLISQYASQYVKVALSGDGGDELFGGYQWYEYLQQSETARSMQCGEKFILKMLQHGHSAFARKYQQRMMETRLSNSRLKYPNFLERHWFLHTDLMFSRDKWWGMDGKSSHTLDAVRQSFNSINPPGIDQAVEFDVNCYLPGDILVKVDRAALANGLETRSPFLDLDLVEFVWSLPASLRFSRSGSKPLLRAAFEDVWPASLKHRTKQGFGAPIETWLKRTDVLPLIQRICKKGGLLSVILPGIPENLNGLSAQQKWTLLSLGLWLEKQPGDLTWQE